MTEKTLKSNVVLKGKTDAGSHYESKRKEHADSASLALVLACTTTIVGTFFDYQIYKPIADRLEFANSDFSNLVACLFLAAIPIAGAWILAHLMVKCMNKAARKSWHIVAFIVVLIGIIALLAFTCWLRVTQAGANISEEQLVYAWTINALAILIAIVAFVIHLFLAINRERHKILAEEASIQRDYTEDSGEGRRFANTSYVDAQREATDHKNYCNAHEDLADQSLDRMELSRDINAQLYADSPIQVKQVKEFPYRIGGKAYGRREDAKAALLKILDAPINDAAHHAYGAPQNRLLDSEANEIMDDLDKRYRAIINNQSV